jgi:predicted nuclease with TOPRIM domain
MSSTPRSDEESFVCDKGTVVSIYFAETLERELAAMKSENDELNKLLSEQQANWGKDLKKCSDELARATESSMAGLRREQQRLADELRSVTAERDALQARVDTLMLEFCPDEMTVEQIVRWETSQARSAK